MQSAFFKLFAKISAVEGIDLNYDVRQELEEFDRLGLSQDARRKIVRERFVKKSRLRQKIQTGRDSGEPLDGETVLAELLVEAEADIKAV